MPSIAPGSSTLLIQHTWAFLVALERVRSEFAGLVSLSWGDGLSCGSQSGSDSSPR